MNRSAAASPIKAVVFDAYGTLFDVHSVASLAEQLFPGSGEALSQLWRQKQLEYSWMRAMSGRYKKFREVTRDALRFAAARLALPITPELEVRPMNQYASRSAFPENLAALRQLKAAGLPPGILSNGNREMIERIYALGLAAFGCNARQILFVSSNCRDAIAAPQPTFRPIHDPPPPGESP